MYRDVVKCLDFTVQEFRSHLSHVLWCQEVPTEVEILSLEYIDTQVPQGDRLLNYTIHYLANKHPVITYGWLEVDPTQKKPALTSDRKSRWGIVDMRLNCKRWQTTQRQWRGRHALMTRAGRADDRDVDTDDRWGIRWNEYHHTEAPT